MTDASNIGLAAAFAAGIVSFLSPCVLPVVPGYVSYIAGQASGLATPRVERGRVTAFVLSACFVLGFGSVFVTLGASATAIGRLLVRYRYEANLVGGVIVIAFGLLMIGALRFVPWLGRDLRVHPRLAGGHPGTAFILGIAFGFGWTPCIGPILGAILTVSAVQSTLRGGVGLLIAYALGLGVPFLLAAVFTRELIGRMNVLRRAAVANRRGRRDGAVRRCDAQRQAHDIFVLAARAIPCAGAHRLIGEESSTILEALLLAIDERMPHRSDGRWRVDRFECAGH